MDEMEFTEAESNMHDLVFPLRGSTSNTRLLNTNNIKMPQSRQQRSMMKSHMPKKVQNEDLCPCDTTWCGSCFNFPNYLCYNYLQNASVNPTEAFNDRCSGFLMYIGYHTDWPRTFRSQVNLHRRYQTAI